MKRFLTTGISVFLMAFVLANAEEDSSLHPEVKKAREAFEATQNEIEKPLLELDEFYLSKLNALKEEFQSAGNLEAVLELDTHIKAVEAGNEQEDSDREVLVKLRKTYEEEWKRRSEGLQNDLEKAFNSYQENLAGLEKQLTQQGEIESALAISKERERVERLIENEKFLSVRDWKAEEEWRASIPTDAMQFEGHFYKVFDEEERVTWTDAKSRCEEMGGHLATISNTGEQKIINALAEDRKHMWLGAYSDESGKNWQWIDGSSLSYKNWREGRPDNTGGVNYMITNRWEEWDDGPNGGAVFSFVCEWE